MPRVPRSLLVLALLLTLPVVLSPASSLAADANRPLELLEGLPQGWGGATFRMSVDEVQALFDNSLILHSDTGEPPDGVTSFPRVVFLRKLGQDVFGMKCDVTFQFAADQLYFISFKCPDPAEMFVTVQREFGEPNAFWLDTYYWKGETTGISLQESNSVFGFYDRELDRLLQNAMRAQLIRQAQGLVESPPQPGQAADGDEAPAAQAAKTAAAPGAGAEKTPKPVAP